MVTCGWWHRTRPAGSPEHTKPYPFLKNHIPTISHRVPPSGAPSQAGGCYSWSPRRVLFISGVFSMAWVSPRPPRTSKGAQATRDSSSRIFSRLDWRGRLGNFLAPKKNRTRIFYFPLNDSWTPPGCSRAVRPLRNASVAALLPPPLSPPCTSLGYGRDMVFQKGIWFWTALSDIRAVQKPRSVPPTTSVDVNIDSS